MQIGVARWLRPAPRTRVLIYLESMYFIHMKVSNIIRGYIWIYNEEDPSMGEPEIDFLDMNNPPSKNIFTSENANRGKLNNSISKVHCVVFGDVFVPLFGFMTE